MPRHQPRAPLVQFNILVREAVIEAFDKILDERRAKNPLAVITRSDLAREAFNDFIARHHPASLPAPKR